MTTYQNNRGEKWLLVPVISEAKNFQIWHNISLSFYHGDDFSGIPLPQHDLKKIRYTLICTSDEITEDQAKSIVDSDVISFYRPAYLNYSSKKFRYSFTPKQSFQSLLHSLTLSRVVVLKIEE